MAVQSLPVWDASTLILRVNDAEEQAGLFPTMVLSEVREAPALNL